MRVFPLQGKEYLGRDLRTLLDVPLCYADLNCLDPLFKRVYGFLFSFVSGKSYVYHQIMTVLHHTPSSLPVLEPKLGHLTSVST